MTSLTSISFDGNINIGSGQLGLIKKVITSVVGSELLWNFADKYNTYIINSTNSIDVILPNIGNLSTDAKLGYRVNIKNVGNTILTLKNTLAATMVILNPTNYCTLYADDSVTQNWIIFNNPNPILINYQTTDVNIGNSTITEISSGDATTTSSVICTPANLALSSTGPITLTSASINLSSLPTSTASDLVYYNSVTKNISHSPILTISGFENTQVSLNPSSTPNTVISGPTMPAGFLVTPGDLINYKIIGFLTNTSILAENNTLFLYIGGSQIWQQIFLTANASVGAQYKFSITGSIMVKSFSSNVAACDCDAQLIITHSSTGATSGTYASSIQLGFNASNTFQIALRGTTGANSTMTYRYGKFWKIT